MMEKNRSIYRRGAEDGLIMGPLLAVAVILVGATAYVPWLFVLAVVAVVAVPSLMMVLMRRSYIADGYDTTFSALWLQGICTFFFGSLLMGVAVYAALRWVWPGYIAEQIRLLVDILAQSSDESSLQMSKALGRLLQTGNIPTPIDMVLELIYIAVFTGSILSMLLALVTRSRRRTTPPPFKS